MTASRRPWLVAVCSVEPWLSVNPVSALMTAEKFGGAAHGRPRVLGLVEERRDPGHEQQAPRSDRDQGGPGSRLGVTVTAAAHDGHDEPDADHGDEVEGPVLGVEQRRRHHGGRHEVAGARRTERPLQRQEAAAGQEDDQRVHARLGGVVHGERGARQQHQRRPRHRPAAQALAAQPGHREGDHRDHAGQGAHGVVGLPEEARSRSAGGSSRAGAPRRASARSGSRATGVGRCRP